MANAQVPYFLDGKWQMDVDPSDKNHVVGNLTKDLTDRATSAIGVTAAVKGVTILEGPDYQDSATSPVGMKPLMIALVTIDPAYVGMPSITFAASCANGELIHRTIYFNTETH
jgi:hypothetical protein